MGHHYPPSAPLDSPDYYLARNILFAIGRTPGLNSFSTLFQHYDKAPKRTRSQAASRDTWQPSPHAPPWHHQKLQWLLIWMQSCFYKFLKSSFLQMQDFFTRQQQHVSFHTVLKERIEKGGGGGGEGEVILLRCARTGCVFKRAAIVRRL